MAMRSVCMLKLFCYDRAARSQWSDVQIPEQLFVSAIIKPELAGIISRADWRANDIALPKQSYYCTGVGRFNAEHEAVAGKTAQPG